MEFFIFQICDYNLMHSPLNHSYSSVAILKCLSLVIYYQFYANKDKVIKQKCLKKLSFFLDFKD